jgi:transaldolase
MNNKIYFMKPQNLKTRIFLDSGSAIDTKTYLDKLGFLDGQTTNPTYFAKSKEVQERIEKEGKFTKQELHDQYEETVSKVSKLIPDGSVSIEVYADTNTTADDMMTQAREMYQWIPNAHIKFPTIPEGLKAANIAVSEGMRVNMTVVFQQEQAAAVYSATKGAKKGQVFVSPFVGRHYDAGDDGVGLIKNIIEMYKQGDGHVEVLTASMRSLHQFYACIHLGTDIITVGTKYLDMWHEDGMKVPGDDFVYNPENLKPILYKDISLDKPLDSYNLEHPLATKGLSEFVADWKNLME